MPDNNLPISPGGQGASPEHAPSIPGHELLRQFARGGYGEIWLARTELGAFRALKIIRRTNFTNTKPFDREFAGIQRYEPISREHEGLVDVLQVGRDEAAGFFYYVMELADDACGGPLTPSLSPSDGERVASSRERGVSSAPFPLFSPSGYVPLTLAHAIRTRTRLPVSEVIELGIQLAHALEFLHSRRLAHRDVKPSNIIFVDGQAKLADVGLVADLGNPQSLVGKLGYIPPEGPGTAQADIYSLGKVLYEAATGKDRQEFPDLPTRLGDGQDDPVLVELNEVLLKACEGKSRARYRSAGEMAADLERLKAGQSLRKRRARCRRIKRLTFSATPIVIAAAAVWFAYYWFSHHGLFVVRQLSNAQVTDWLAAYPADWDSLPGKELLVTQESKTEGNTLWGFGSDGRFLARWSCPNPAASAIVLQMVADLDGDGRDEALASWTSGTNCFISEIRHSGWEKLPRFLAYGREPVAENLRATSRLLPALVLPGSSSHDGRRKLIATLQTYFGGSPRALCCFDIVTRTQCWQRVVAPSLDLVQPLDLDRDGQPELLVGSSAVSNTNVLPDGTDDVHSYIYAFSLAGELLWRQELGGVHTSSAVVALEYGPERSPRLYAWVSGRPDGKWQAPPHGSVVELGTDGSILRSFRHESPLLSCIPAPFAGDTNQHLLVTDPDGFVYHLGADLVEKAKRRLIGGTLRAGAHDRKTISLLKVGTLAPGREVEIVAQSSLVRAQIATNVGDPSAPANDAWLESGDILILRTNLEVVARYQVAKHVGQPFNWTVIAADVDGDGHDEILSLTDKATILKRRGPFFGH